MVEERYAKIAKAFGLQGILKETSHLGNGHINDTVLLVFDDNGIKRELVLQKINKYVFHHPDELMERFVRGDKSRHTEGHGLGLSVVSSLMELQNAKSEIEVNADLFVITLVFQMVGCMFKTVKYRMVSAVTILVLAGCLFVSCGKKESKNIVVEGDVTITVQCVSFIDYYIS